MAALLLPFYFLLFTCFSFAQTLAPGAPGRDAQWATAGKQGVGSAANVESKIWFTLAEGALTEVYYPDVTVANVHLLQFVVVDPKTRKVETEQTDAVHQIKVLRPDALTFQQINTAKSGEWTITKTYVTDVERASVLIDVEFRAKNKNLNLYVYFDPSIGNSGMGDRAYAPLLQMKGSVEHEKGTATANGVRSQKETRSATVSAGMGAEDGNIAAALYLTSDLEELTSGYSGVSDGLDQLGKFGKIRETYAEAPKGNVVQMARVMKPARFTTVLSFGEDIWKASVNASKSLIEKGFAKARAEYEAGWAEYVKNLPRVEPKYQAQLNMAAMQLKIHEDKTVRGANIASLTVPWGGGENANANNIGGYHLIWSRDLYQVATAFMALGDIDAAKRALNFLFKVQQKEDGSFPQNSFLDGKPFWGSLQMDEVAYPLILAHELAVNDRETYENHVKRAADFIVKNGPKTPQERWEEEGGYSPSTIAAEIAGLVCAAEIARKNGDDASADLYLGSADDWARSVEKWTVTTTGKYSKAPYYVRITQNGKPDAGERIELNNGAGFFDEREIVDAGFLELVRLGIKAPDDKIIQNSLKVVDEVIRVGTPNGDAFYRYNHDGYGEMDDGRRWNWDGKYTGKGRLWALLSGERGQYELAIYALGAEKNGDKPLPRGYTKWELVQKTAERRLDSMLGFANEGLMIPEQIWDRPETPKSIDKQFVPELKFGEGTGSATPLAWSMAQFIRLAVNLKAGKNLDTPRVVYDRYVLGKKSEATGQKTEEKTAANDCPNLDVYRYDAKDVLMTLPSRDEKYPRPFGQNGEKETAMRFAYFGSEQDVEIAGDFTGWKPCGLKFIKIKALPNVNYLILKFPNKARVEYKLIVDGKWIVDPANPKRVDNGVGGENSYFEMPDYQPTNWDVKNDSSAGVETIEIDSKIYGKRTLKIYVPFIKSDGPAFFPVMYVQDGSDYLTRAKAVQIQQNLVSAGKVKPFMMVFLDPKDRMKEYWANDDYAKFVAEEVVPVVDAKYKTIKTRDGRAILGASLGGVTSVNVALKYPQVFSRIGGQSASFWIDDERVVKELSNLDSTKAKFKFYFDDGSLEGAQDTRRVNVLLRAKGYPVTYVEGETGHNWTAWRDRLADAFVALMN